MNTDTATSGVTDSAIVVPTRPDQDNSNHRYWLGVAQRVAEELAHDALERDRANNPPHAEIEILRSAGLLGLTVPRSSGGSGATYRTAFAVVRIIARVDPSIAQILGYHFDISNRILEAGDAAIQARVMADAVHHQWLFATPGASRERKLLTVTRGPDGIRRVSGRRIFATGSGVADRIRGYGIEEGSGRRLVFLLDTSRITRDGEWDFLGQRLSASSGFVVDDYVLDDADVIADYPAPPGVGNASGIFEYHLPLTVMSQELVFSSIYLGIAEGALEFARNYTREHARPFTGSSAATASDDPYIRQGYGELLARTAAAAAILDRAEQHLQEGYDLGEGLTSDDQTDLWAVVSSAKYMTEDVAVDVSNRIFSFTGARSAGTRWGTDRFWRNIRTLSLHDPIVYHTARVGDWFLSDRGRCEIPGVQR